MPFSGIDPYKIIIHDFVNESVFLVNPSRPVASEDQRNTFYPAVRPELDGGGSGLGGSGQAGLLCSVCDHNHWKWEDEVARRNYTAAFITAAGHSLLLSNEFRVASRGKFVHVNGKTYSNRFFGNQHVSKYTVRASKLNTATTARFISRVSTGLVFAGAVYTAFDGITNGWQNHHTADLVLTGGFYALSASVPVAGWIVGGSYFLADITTQYYTGRSITQYIFD